MAIEISLDGGLTVAAVDVAIGFGSAPELSRRAS